MSQRLKNQKGMCFKANKRGVSVQAGRTYEQLSKPPGLGERNISFSGNIANALNPGSERNKREGGRKG